MTDMPRLLTPGTISPELGVPQNITRPEYVGRADADEGRGSNFYSAEEIEKVRVAGRIAANALAAVGDMIEPGVTTDAIDRVAHEYMCDHGAYPSTLGYRGFPKSVCTSLNEVICHGIPDSTVIAGGDIVNVDITAYIDGMHGDTNFTFYAGEVDDESRLLVERTWEATMRGIKAVKPGREINVIGRVIEKYAKRFDYGVVRDYSGHGVGREFHTGLIVPHYDAAPAHAEVMEPGMIFTIEPMLNLGTVDWDVWDDAWTVVTKDRKRSAQFEHTLVVTETGADILTLPDADAAIAAGPTTRQD
ncbi:type I methionyl aminopeptidase [Brevibacterium sp. UCMA 11754]|uniref:type I methionyl aminopeptidase n=1 Tax=Brevibacterium sp. UCMA 11754 TaxID=2749198 RepID=UPI001F2A3BE2|nr:type I methionyl aminopeptidase [Brevibacterium sp. UCMA 11754]MCF2574362.1 type I methionyl aminopeptidase [Brevibacterium sp. UCMA 11754]